MLQIVGIVLFLLIRFAFEASKDDVRSSKSTYKRNTFGTNYGDPFSKSTTTDMSLSDYKRTTLNEIKYEMKDLEQEMPEEVDALNKAIEEAEKVEDDFFMPPKREESNDDSNKSNSDDMETTQSSPLNKIKFMLITLIYVMYEDDGEFSRKEKKIVQTAIKVVGKRFSLNERDELESLVLVRPNLDYIFDRVTEYGLTPEDVYRTVKDLKKTVKNKSEYENIFKRIENRMQYEI